MMLRVKPLIFVFALVACNGDSGEDQTNVNSADAANGSTIDAGNNVADADRGEADASADAGADRDGSGPDMPALDAALDANIDMTVADVAADAMVDADVDAAPDAGDPFAGQPVGQCVENADCPNSPNGANCQQTAPGGVCLGCGSDDHCPSNATCTMFGACAIDCNDDGDCPPGAQCGTQGLCRITRCQNDVCPIPLFGCNDANLCSRIDCGADPTVCPAMTTCTNGLCVEDRALD